MAVSYEVGLIMAAMEDRGYPATKLFSPPPATSSAKAKTTDPDKDIRYSTDSASILKGTANSILQFPEVHENKSLMYRCVQTRHPNQKNPGAQTSSRSLPVALETIPAFTRRNDIHIKIIQVDWGLLARKIWNGMDLASACFIVVATFRKDTEIPVGKVVRLASKQYFKIPR